MTIINGVIEELNGIEYTTQEGNVVTFNNITYLEFAKMLSELSDKEAISIREAITNKIGKEGLQEILDKMNKIVEGLEEDIAMEDITTPNRIEMIKPDYKYAYQQNEFVMGIISMSKICGQYTALLNSGFTNAQAYEIVTFDHEMQMMDKQIELKKLELENQVKLGSVKQLLS